ncbi:MAG: DUF1289 domain-containing protein [Thalassotalea sp.]
MTKTLNDDSSKKSPCVRNCCLDENDICLGCFRTLSEIVGWQTKPDSERKQILENCQTRQQTKRNLNR